MIDRFSQQHSKLSFYQCHCETALLCSHNFYFLEDMEWSRDQDIKACSKRQTASIVLFQDFQRGTIMYCIHLARIDSSIKPRHLIQMILP